MAGSRPEGDGGRPGVAEVAEHIRSKVLLGEYGPEGRLVEWRIARELGVSRTPVRQALTVVEAEGLIEIFPNRGAIVASFGADEVWAVYDLRASLEGLAARRAAESIGGADLGKLRELAAEMEFLDGELRASDVTPADLITNPGTHGRRTLGRRMEPARRSCAGIGGGPAVVASCPSHEEAARGKHGRAQEGARRADRRLGAN